MGHPPALVCTSKDKAALCCTKGRRRQFQCSRNKVFKHTRKHGWELEMWLLGRSLVWFELTPSHFVLQISQI